MTAARATSPARRAALGKVHLAKKELGLDDDTYRAVLVRVTGCSSAADCSDAALGAVLDEFKRLGWKPREPHGSRGAKRRKGRSGVQGPLQAKILALWLSLHALGEVEDASDAALAAFVKRTTGRDALAFLRADTADAVIKALRGWQVRVGFKPPTAEDERAVAAWRAEAGLDAPAPGFAAKVRTIEAQWDRLIALGAMRAGIHAGLGTWLTKTFGVSAPWFLTAPQADVAAQKLGRWLRAEKVKAKAE